MQCRHKGFIVDTDSPGKNSGLLDRYRNPPKKYEMSDVMVKTPMMTLETTQNDSARKYNSQNMKQKYAETIGIK